MISILSITSQSRYTRGTTNFQRENSRSAPVTDIRSTNLSKGVEKIVAENGTGINRQVYSQRSATAINSLIVI